MKRNNHVYIIILPVIVYYLVFHYGPMYGALIAFKNYRPAVGVWGSPWVGLKHFRDFFNSYFFVRILRNTLLLSIYSLIFGFPAPIILALLLNEVRKGWYKKLVQTITYVPHFISLVIICGIIVNFVKMDGVISIIVSKFGRYDGNLLLEPKYFRSIYVISGIWQQIGWGSIIYLATLAGIDVEMYEAARIDGAGRWKQTWYITLPCLVPTITILFILRIGDLLNVGYEKVMLLYNAGIYETADIISTFVYRQGILSAQFSFSSAIDLFNSLIGCILVILANQFSKKMTENSLW